MLPALYRNFEEWRETQGDAMKEIRAYIQPFMLSRLTQALLEIPDFPGMSVSDCEGFGRDTVIDRDFTPYIAGTAHRNICAG